MGVEEKKVKIGILRKRERWKKGKIKVQKVFLSFHFDFTFQNQFSKIKKS